MKRLFVVGAGASLAAPANLPLFDALRRVLAEWMGIDTEVGRRLPPEVFMNCVANGLGPDRLATWLVEALGPRPSEAVRQVGDPAPNAVHAILGSAMRAGDPVWSLNVDELIETAVQENDPEFFTRLSDELVTHRGEPGSLHDGTLLMKPHGTLAKRNFIFRTSQVIRPLPTRWAARLDADVATADEVVFIGYRGADVDLRAPLDAALRHHCPKVAWFCLTRGQEDLKREDNQDWRDACRYLPALSGLDVDVRITANPSADFLLWAAENQLAGWVSELQRRVIDDVHQRRVDPPRGRSRLSRGLLLELLNEVALAEDAFVAEMARGRHVRTSAFRYLKLRWYAGDRRLEPLKSLDRAGVLRPIPVIGHRIRRADLMYLSSVVGDHDVALSLARRSDKNDPATWIVIAKAERNAGNCESALHAAREASRLAAPPETSEDTADRDEKTPPSRADEKAHAVFEEIFALTWLGRYREARSVLTTLYDGYDAQARVRWIGWAKYLEAGLMLLNGNGQGAAVELQSAKAFFEADDVEGRRRAACDVLAVAAYRIQGDPRNAKSMAEMAWVPSGSEPNLEELAASRAFEVAETAREVRSDTDAGEHYRLAASLGHRPQLRCAAKLGLAELETTPEDLAESHLNEAMAIATSCRFRRLLADVAVTAHRRRLLRRDEALDRLRQYKDVLPGWDDATGTDVEHYLDGHHRIVCVW